jgi:hypothetical protein
LERDVQYINRLCNLFSFMNMNERKTVYFSSFSLLGGAREKEQSLVESCG